MTNPRHRVYLITGANGGLGLEATRQLIERARGWDSQSGGVIIYLLCRSETKARAAIDLLESQQPEFDLNLRFVKFDAFDLKTVENLSIPEEHITGLLLNAGGFGDSGQPCRQIGESGATAISHLNLLAHAVLVKKLLSEKKIGRGTRIVAAGSEASFTSPGLHVDYKNANFRDHLTGEVGYPLADAAYVWIKGILALYWAGFSAQHPEVFVATVSPGSVPSTNLWKQAGATRIIAFFAKMASTCIGGNSLQDGAKIFVDALLGTEEDSNVQIKSGDFFAHRSGFAKDFGNVTEMKKGAIFGDTEVQNRAYKSVEELLQ